MAATPDVRSGSVRTADGRTLAYRDSRSPDGIPIVSHHGMPGSRLERPADEFRLPAQLRVRMIGLHRAGYGGSDPSPGRLVVDAADDVAALADPSHRDVHRRGPLTSPSSPRRPSRSRRSPPTCSRSWTSSGRTLTASSTRSRPSCPRRTGRSSAVPRTAPSRASRCSRPCAKGPRGWIDDDHAFGTGWGFALADARCETRLWQGELDVLVPQAHRAYLAARLPHGPPRPHPRRRARARRPLAGHPRPGGGRRALIRAAAAKRSTAARRATAARRGDGCRCARRGGGSAPPGSR